MRQYTYGWNHTAQSHMLKKSIAVPNQTVFRSYSDNIMEGIGCCHVRWFIDRATLKDILRYGLVLSLYRNKLINGVLEVNRSPDAQISILLNENICLDRRI